MLPRFDAGQVLAAITRTRATAMPGVPTMYRALLDHPRLSQTDFSSLKFCISGGAPMPPELKERFEAAAWYWHFVDVVWLFLFVTIYVWGGWGAPIHGG